jgi:hypothetical protein
LVRLHEESRANSTRNTANTRDSLANSTNFEHK